MTEEFEALLKELTEEHPTDRGVRRLAIERWAEEKLGLSADEVDEHLRTLKRGGYVISVEEGCFSYIDRGEYFFEEE